MFSAFIVLLLAASVSAHGVIVKGFYNGKTFGPGNDINPIRNVSNPLPNTNKKSPDLTCGPDAKPAPDVLEVNAGDEIQLLWSAVNNFGWPHNKGPMFTYFANCGDVSCDKFDQGKASFFKTDQLGKKGDTSDQWFQADIYNNGNPGEFHNSHVRIPKNLRAGNYLLRHEIIALHLHPVAEFYPGCVQLKVSGDGKDGPDESELVKIPGAYHDEDTGFNDVDELDGHKKYDFPGPPVAKAFRDSSDPSRETPETNSTSIPPSTSTPRQPSVNVNAVKSLRTPTPSPSHPRRIMRRGKVENGLH